MMRRPSSPHLADAHALWQHGMHPEEIAQQFGLATITVWVWARKYGWPKIQRPRKPIVRATPAWVAEARAIFERVGSIKETAREIGKGEAQVSTWRHRQEWVAPEQPKAEGRVCLECNEWLPSSRFAKRTTRSGQKAMQAYCYRCKHVREARRRGRTVTSKGERTRLAQERRIRRDMERLARLETKKARSAEIQAMVSRLLVDDPDSRTCTGKALIFRALYRYDDAFRAKQIERQHRKKSQEWGRPLLSDGSLNKAAVARLFSNARECLYCGCTMQSQDKTLDHIVPRAKGGWHSIKNAVVCCRWCNTRKHSAMPDVWLSRLPDERRAIVARAWARITSGEVDQLWLVA